MKVLKSFLPYLLIAVLMAGIGGYNAHAEELFFSDLPLYRLGMFIVPLLVTLVGVVAGRGMRLPGFYPRWRVVLDGVLALCLFLVGNSALTLNVLGWSDAVWTMVNALSRGRLESICALFAGILLGRLTLLAGAPRAGHAAPEQGKGAVQALKSLVPYLFVAALMWLMWLGNVQSGRLIFILGKGDYIATYMLAPLLPLLMGVVAGRGMRLPAAYPLWRAVPDGVLALGMFLAGHSWMILYLFGPFSKAGLLAASIAKGELRVPLMLLAGMLLGRLTLLPARRAKTTAPV